MAVELEEVFEITAGGDAELITIDFTDKLYSGEILTGTPTVVELDGRDGDTATTEYFTLASKTVRSTTFTYTLNGEEKTIDENECVH